MNNTAGLAKSYFGVVAGAGMVMSHWGTFL